MRACFFFSFFFSCPKNKNKKDGEKGRKVYAFDFLFYVVTCPQSLSSVSFPHGFRHHHYSSNFFNQISSSTTFVFSIFHIFHFMILRGKKITGYSRVGECLTPLPSLSSSVCSFSVFRCRSAVFVEDNTASPPPPPPPNCGGELLLKIIRHRRRRRRQTVEDLFSAVSRPIIARK